MRLPSSPAITLLCPPPSPRLCPRGNLHTTVQSGKPQSSAGARRDHRGARTRGTALSNTKAGTIARAPWGGFQRHYTLQKRPASQATCCEVHSDRILEKTSWPEEPQGWREADSLSQGRAQEEGGGSEETGAKDAHTCWSTKGSHSAVSVTELSSQSSSFRKQIQGLQRLVNKEFFLKKSLNYRLVHF